ncbi:hypothetical protein NCC49_002362 [Naganishia albida]|nr:hypothetical protein NCC49_002362 [Naganishia albida]
MSQPLQEISFIPAEDFARDLAVLKTNPALLDAFLPLALQSRTSTQSQPSILDNYNPSSATPEDSVTLSRAFVDTARNGALKLVDDGADGRLGKLGDEIEQVRARAEQLQHSLEGM